MTSSPLVPLFKLLHASPSRPGQISEQTLFSIWRSFKQIDPEQGDSVVSAMLVGLILYDEDSFAELLNESEHAQLAILGRRALERYLQTTNPPNPVGKSLAASLKDSI